MFIRLADNPWFLLAIPVAVILAIRIFQRPVIGIYISSFLIPFEDLTTLFTDVTLLKILLGYTFIVWSSKSFILKDRINFYQMSYIILLIIWSIFSLTWSYDLNVSLGRLIVFVQLIFFTIMTINLLNNESDIEKIMVIYVMASLLTSIMAIDLLSSGVLHRNRAAYIEGQNPNGFSRSVGVALLYLIYFFQTNKIKKKSLFYIIGSIFLIVVIFAQSRTTYIALLVSLIPVIYFSKLGNKIRISLLGLIPTIIIFYFFQDTFYNFVLPRTQSVFTEFSMGGRDVIWVVAWEMIKDNFLFGVGFGNFTSVYGEYSTQLRGWYAETDPHNVYIAIVAELGIIGLLLFIGFLKSIYTKIMSIDPKYLTDRTFILSIFIYNCISAMANSLHYAKHFWLIFAIIIAFINQNKYSQLNIIKDNDNT